MTSPDIPQVSVVMAVHNGERHLGPAIESILNQTLRDFEFIIIDDASSDQTADILAEYARRDGRIRLVRNETNLGLTKSLNVALALARCPIIARMDADDISDPARLEYQIAFLDAHPEHLLVTTSYRAMDDAGHTLYVKVKPADDFCVRWLSRFRMSLEHPSACYRAVFPDGTPVRYDEDFVVAQDFELFSRLIAAGKAAVLPQILFHYRLHPSNISSTRRGEQKSNTVHVTIQVQKRELPEELAGTFDDLLSCYLLREPAKPEVVRKSVDAFDRMLAHDFANNPNRKTWLKRQSAEILADAILKQGGGFKNPSVLAAFIVHAWHYFWPLFWRVLENKRYLPTWLQSYPHPAGPRT